MPSGQQLSEINYLKFLNWRDAKSKNDFRQYVFRNKLSRKKIAIECDFAKSVLNQNPKIKQALLELENSLKKIGVLSQDLIQTQRAPVKVIKTPENNHIKKLITQLENENMSLKVENKTLKDYLKKYNMIDLFLSETMRIPR